MSTTEIMERLEKKIDSLSKKVDRLTEKKPKRTLVKATEIVRLTGWNREEMRRARENGFVKQVRQGNKIFYTLESLNPTFIINPTFIKNDLPHAK